MPLGLNVILSGLLIALLCVTAVAAAKRPGSHWQYFHFDGHSFIAGQPAGDATFVAVNKDFMPAVLTHASKPKTMALPPDKGVLVGFCYIQSSGGKLTSSASYQPGARMPVEITANGKHVAVTETDDKGYFVIALSAGSYHIICKETVEAKVENGTTILVPLRVGKRMVD